MTHFKYLKTIATLLILWPLNSWANNQTLLVLDQHGEPLSQVVIEIATQKAPPSSQTPLPIAVMDQVDKRFVPDLVLIQAGQKVSFPNSDNIRHHVYSFSPAKPFELKLYSGQPKLPLTFEQAGVVILGCNIHDSMIGYIYVASQAATITNSKGIAQLPATAQSVTLWHSNQTPGPDTRTTVVIDESLVRQADGTVVFTLQTTTPKPRDTFQERFRGANQ